MKELFYSMIFKRKSFHVFKEYSCLSIESLKDIENAFLSFEPLNRHIKVDRT